MSNDPQIFCLVPDMPAPEQVSTYLEEIHSNRWYTNFGPINQRFEDAMVSFFAQQGSAGLSVGTFSSATTALELMLRALQLSPSARVLVPVLTFPATALAAINAGLEPVFADVDALSWELTPETARRAHAVKPLDAVLPVAAFGKPIPVEGWLAFQRETGVRVLLDAAAVLGQQPTSPELVTVYSLHATKPFGVGEGGLVATGDAELLARAKSLSNFGFAGSEGMVHQVGTNAKFGEYYAAVGLAQIDRWQEVISARRRVAEAYISKLAPLRNKIRLQADFEDFVPAVFPVFAEGKREAIQARMALAGIQTRHWYLPLLHKHPALKHLSFAEQGEAASIATALELEAGLVGLPFHAFLSDDDIDKICTCLAEIV